MTNFCDDIVMTGPTESSFRLFDAQLAERWGDCKVQKPDYLLGCDLEQDSIGIRLTAATRIRHCTVRTRHRSRETTRSDAGDPAD